MEVCFTLTVNSRPPETKTGLEGAPRMLAARPRRASATRRPSPRVRLIRPRLRRRMRSALPKTSSAASDQAVAFRVAEMVALN